jgi:conjugal transfer pilus assembly protein TraD
VIAIGQVASGVAISLVCAAAGAGILHRLNWRGTFALVPGALAALLAPWFLMAYSIVGACVLCFGLREYWRLEDIKKGQDKSRRARRAIGVWQCIGSLRDRRRLHHGRLRRPDAYAIGIGQAGETVWAPLGRDEGRHSLVIGATGAGKTTTLVAAAQAHLEAGCALIAIDAKGDPKLLEQFRALAQTAGREFHSFSLTGDSDHWNPLARGGPSENADKLIAAEEWTEPHYQRLYQRYLLTVFTAIRGQGATADLPGVVDLLDPSRLAMFARGLSDGPIAAHVDRYLSELTDREARDLAGLRNRLALLTEGEHGHLLAAGDETEHEIDLLTAIGEGQVVAFSLNTFLYPETAKLLGAALLQDLKGVAGILETEPHRGRPAAVLVDEFGALGADHIIGLFQRGRSARLSLMLATQELADLRSVDPTFQDQVLGNLESVVAHRQNVPDSAELVCQIAGTRDTWIHTFQTNGQAPLVPRAEAPRGTRHRAHEFLVAPDSVKQLEAGEAIVITKNPHTVHITTIRPARMARTAPAGKGAHS